MRVYVDVHEVVHNLTLDVVLHPVDQETTADIDDLDEGKAPACRRQKQIPYKHKRNMTQGLESDNLALLF